MRSNYLKINTVQKTIVIFSIIIGFGLTTFIPMGSAQAQFYPPFQYNFFNYGYFPLANPFFYTYQTRNAALLLGGTPGVPTPGGGLTTSLLPTLTPTLFPTLTPTVTTPTIGVTTALILGGGGGGIATTLTLLNTIPLTTAPTIATTPTIGTTTAILLGGSINTTTLLLLGIL